MLPPPGRQRAVHRRGAAGRQARPVPERRSDRQDPADLPGHFQSVQGVIVDPADRLWVLDTGIPGFAGSSYGGPKIVAIDLRTNKIVRRIVFPTSVVPADSYINDMRFDLRRGKAGKVYITDRAAPSASSRSTSPRADPGAAWPGTPRRSRTRTSSPSSTASPSPVSSAPTGSP
nr:L-dopachrome tautomerase-related protein [Streptomyces liangshanensis]